MRSRGLLLRHLPRLAALCAAATALALHHPVLAAQPMVTIGATGVKIQVAQASLSEAIDALARAAGFKVTYEGARPAAMLYNTEIDTPTVAQSLFRLIDGQNLNYAVMFDLSGKKVISLMVLGAPPKAAGSPGSPAGGTRPQAFTPPRRPGNEPTVVVDDPVEPEPEPTSQPTPVPSPPVPVRGGPDSPTSPFPPSSFGPRPIGSPITPRPSPSPSP